MERNIIREARSNIWIEKYLAITGMNIKSVLITKAAWVWPFQRCNRFSVQPHDYAMNMQGTFLPYLLSTRQVTD